MIHNAISSTVRFGVHTTSGTALFIVENTIGRLLATNPDKLR